MTPLWMTAFLDFAADEYDAGLAFWRSLTGYDVSPARGPEGEFVTLVPPAGGDHLRVQRLGKGPSRIHLDLHVADVDAAAEDALRAGASRLDQPHSDVVTLGSPGGFAFCLVTPAPPQDRPRPTTWPGGHASLVDQVCVDIPESAYDVESAFWQEVTGRELRPSAGYPEFANLVRPPDQPLRILLQRLGEPDGQVRAHLDWSTTDRAAEIRRHVAAGAEVQEEFRHWTVLTGPVGPAYCITHRKPEP